MSTHYEVLGVSPTATSQQVKAAFDKIVAAQADLLVFRLPEAVEDAFTTLSDPGRRAAYDASLLPPKIQEPPRPAATPPRPVGIPRPSTPAPPPVPTRPVTLREVAPSSRPRVPASTNRYNDPPVSPVAAPRISSPRAAIPAAAAPVAAPAKRPPVAAPKAAPTKSQAKGWMRWLVAIGLLWWGGSYVVRQLQAKGSGSSQTVAFAGRVTSKTGLKLRAEPDKAAEVVDKIYYFETVAVLQNPDSSEEESQMVGTTKWYKVTHAGKTGWVLAEYIKRL